jgi:hypothetical protein
MNTNENIQQFAARRGFTWEQWKSLPISARYGQSALDRGETITDAMRASWAVMDLPADQRLAAFKAGL